MLMLICLIVICYMFYSSAKRAKKSGLFWLFNGIALWLVLGYLFLELSDKYILNITTVAETFSLQWQKMLLEGISALIIISIAYLIQNNFIVAKK